MHKSFMLIDNFYPEPLAVRQAALECEFVASERYVGLDGDRKLLHKELDDAVSRLTDQPVAGCVSDDNNHGRFRVTLEQDINNAYQAGIHVDSDECIWAGIVCLTLPQDIPRKPVGTHFYRHKETDITRLPLNAEEEQALGLSQGEVRKLVDRDSNDYDKWDFVFETPFEFNRLVLFRPWYFHDNGVNFGTRIENGRLVHLLFFGPEG